MYCAKLLVATAKQRLAFCEQSVATLAKEQRLARREWWVVVKLASAALLPGPSLSPPAGAVPGLSLSPPAAALVPGLSLSPPAGAVPGLSLSPPAGAVPGLSLSPPATSQQGGRLAR
jgi:hypothetical protein